MTKEFKDDIWEDDWVNAAQNGQAGILIQTNIDEVYDHITLTPSDARDFANQILALVQDIETN